MQHSYRRVLSSRRIATCQRGGAFEQALLPEVNAPLRSSSNGYTGAFGPHKSLPLQGGPEQLAITVKEDKSWWFWLAWRVGNNSAGGGYFHILKRYEWKEKRYGASNVLLILSWFQSNSAKSSGGWHDTSGIWLHLFAMTWYFWLQLFQMTWYFCSHLLAMTWYFWLRSLCIASNT